MRERERERERETEREREMSIDKQMWCFLQKKNYINTCTLTVASISVSFLTLVSFLEACCDVNFIVY